MIPPRTLEEARPRHVDEMLRRLEAEQDDATARRMLEVAERRAAFRIIEGGRQ